MSRFLDQAQISLENFILEASRSVELDGSFAANSSPITEELNDEGEVRDVEGEDEENEEHPLIDEDQTRVLVPANISNEDLNAFQAGFMNNLKQLLPFLLLLLLHSLLSQALKIAYVIISFVALGFITKSFYEAISGASVVVGSLTSSKFLSLLVMTISSVSISYFAFGWIAKDYVVWKHMVIFPQTAKSPSLIESMWLSASLDLFVQQVSLLVKILFWFLCSSDTICSRNCSIIKCTRRMGSIYELLYIIMQS